MLYCPNFFWNVLQVWMTGKDVYLQMTWSWPDKTWNILCSYCLQWNTSQSKFRNHYFLFIFYFSILSQPFSDLGLYIYLINNTVKNCEILQFQKNVFYFNEFSNAIYSCNGKLNFQQSSVFQPLKSHDPTGIIVICWFVLNKYFLLFTVSLHFFSDPKCRYSVDIISSC